MNKLPDNFVYLQDIVPSIVCDIKYATADNIVGRPIAGYVDNVAICTEPVAQALAQVQAKLQQQGCSLLVYEAFRPQRASLDIKAWIGDLTDQKQKARFYPRIEKSRFYPDHYFMEYSAHTRGSAVDVTIIDSKQTPWEMGTEFDFMDDLSHPGNRAVGDIAYENRQFLKALMQSYGFRGIESEWWHFNLLNEPFPDQYFDFEVR